MNNQNLSISLTLDAKTGKLVGKIKGAKKEITKFGSDGQKAGQKIDKGMSKASQGVKGTSKQLDNAKSSMLALLGVASASQLIGGAISTADAYKAMQGQLKLVTNGSEELAIAQSGLHEIAIETRSDITSITKLYSALTPTFKTMGKSSKDSMKLMRTFNKALALTSPTAQESSSAILQFSQAMGSGILRGEEFNSIMENGRGVAMTLAEGLNVPIGALRKMAEQGLLTADVVVDALKRQADAVDKKFLNLPLTVGGAMQNMRTNMMLAIGDFDTMSGVSGTLADGINNMAHNIDTVGDALGITAGVMTAYYIPAALRTAEATKGLRLALLALSKNPWVAGLVTLAAAYAYLSESTDEQTKKLKAKASGDKSQIDIIKEHISALKEEQQYLQNEADNGATPQRQQKAKTQLFLLNQQLIKSEKELSELVKKGDDKARSVQQTGHKLQQLKAIALIQDAEEKAFFDNIARDNQLFFIKSDRLQQYRDMLLEQWNEDDDIAVYKDQQASAQTLKDSINELNVSAKDYGDTWARTGNQIIDAMGSVASVLEESHQKEVDYANQKLQLDELRAQAQKTFKNDKTTLAKVNKKLNKEELKLDKQRHDNSVKGSMAMLDASVGMYKEKSKAQEIAHKASLIFHAAQLTMDIAEAISAATVSVVAQGKGDPYTAWARIAAMSVMMGGLLSQIGASFGGAGGSSPDLSVAAQANQGTGTILGDSSAKSESIANAFELLNDINVDQYAELQGINLGIQLMTGSLKGVTDSFLRSGFANFNGQGFNLDLKTIDNGNLFSRINDIMPVADWTQDYLSDWTGKILGGRTKKSITNSGVDFGAQTLGALINGGTLQGDAFATVKSVKDGGWFKSDKTSYSTQTKDLDAQSELLMGQVFSGLGQTMVGLSDALGLNLEQSINDYVIDLPEISLHNMTGDEINETLQNMVSAQADEMSADLFGAIALTYQKAGEGLYETVNRLVIEKVVVNDHLSAASVTLGSDALATSQALINLAGELSDFESNASDYYDGFFSEQEKSLRNQQNITKQLAEQNIALPKTRDAYRGLVEALDINTEAGQKQYTVMMSLADAANDFYSAIDDLTESLLDHYKKIMGTVSEGDPLELITAQATIADAIAQAQVGNLPTLDSLSDALNVLSSNDNSSYSTLNDFKRDQLINANLIDDLTLAVSDKTVEEHMLEQLEIINANTLANVNTGDGETIASALDVYMAAYSASLEGTGGFRPSAPANETSIGGGYTLQDYYDWVALDGSHASGLDYVPFNGYRAELHQGEAVIDARTMQGMRKYGIQSSNDEGLKNEIIKLRQEVAMLRSENKEGQGILAGHAQDQLDIAEKWDIDGQPETRV